MTLQANLLPVEYQSRARRFRRLKLWIAASVAMVPALVLSSMFLRLRAAETSSYLERTAQLCAEERSVKKQLASLNGKREELDRKVTLAECLRRKHHWSELLAALAQKLPDRVVLTKLTSDPPKDSHVSGERPRVKAGGQSGGKRKDSPGGEGAARGFLIDGIAADPESLAAFLRALDDTERLGRCELRSSSRQRFMSDYAVGFTIYTRW